MPHGLAAHEQQFDVLESLQEPFFILDSDLCIAFINQNCSELLGTDPNKIIGRAFEEVALSTGGLLYHRFALALVRQERMILEDYSSDINRWLEYRISPLKGRLAVLVRDITTVKERENRLWAENEQFNIIFENASVGIARYAFDGRCLEVNTKATAIMGQTKAQFMELGLGAVCLPESPSQYIEHFIALMRGQEIFSTENEILKPNQNNSWVHLDFSVIRNLQGQPQSFLVILYDIAERKANEASLQFALRAAQMAEWDYDATTNQTSRSSYFHQIFGAEKPPQYWRFETFLRRTYRADRALFAVRFREALAGARDFQLNVRIYTDKRELRWISLRGRGYPDEKGRVTRMAGVVSDVTRETLAEMELQNAKLAAEDANREKSFFLANMSHEIRTPLGAIVGFAETMRDPGLERDLREKYLQIITRNGAALSGLIDDILDLSKIEAGYLEVENSPVDVFELITDVTSLLRPKAETKGLSLNVNRHPEVPGWVITDQTRLRQILLNVVGNAVKFTKKGCVTLMVEPRLTHLCFSIHDTGPGISKSQQVRLFQPFTQADSSTTRKYGGSGLGLALSRRLARALGGDLILKNSIPDLGSVFQLTIQLKTSAAPVDKKMPTAPAVQTTLNGLRVLAVDDSVDNRILVKFLLEKKGAIVETAEDGQAGVEMIMANGYDLVLMDMQMPRLDGYSATAYLRKTGVETPVIALTANALRHDREVCLAAGCSAYLSKPIDANKLYQMVSSLVEPKRQ